MKNYLLLLITLFVCAKTPDFVDTQIAFQPNPTGGSIPFDQPDPTGGPILSGPRPTAGGPIPESPFQSADPRQTGTAPPTGGSFPKPEDLGPAPEVVSVETAPLKLNIKGLTISMLTSVVTFDQSVYFLDFMANNYQCDGNGTDGQFNQNYNYYYQPQSNYDPVMSPYMSNLNVDYFNYWRRPRNDSCPTVSNPNPTGQCSPGMPCSGGITPKEPPPPGFNGTYDNSTVFFPILPPPPDFNSSDSEFQKMSSDGSLISNDIPRPQGSFNPPPYRKISDIPACRWIAYSAMFTQSSGYNFLPFNMSCNNIPYIKQPDPTNFGGDGGKQDGPPSILFGAYTEDFVSSVIQNGFKELVDPIVIDPMRYDPTKMIVLYMYTMQNDTTALSVDNSNIPGFIDLFQKGQCQMDVNSVFSSTEYGFPSNKKTTFKAYDANIKSTAASPRMQPWNSECDSTKLEKINERFQTLIDRISGTSTGNGLKILQSSIEFLTTKTAWLRCRNILESFVTTEKKDFTMMTKDCVSGDDLNLDPCCNQTLGARKCCAPRERTVTLDIPSGVNALAVAKTCALDESLIPALTSLSSDFANVLQTVNDPTKGCVAQTLKASGGVALDDPETYIRSLTSFRENCTAEILGTTLASCSSDLDCYSKRCVKLETLMKQSMGGFSYGLPPGSSFDQSSKYCHPVSDNIAPVMAKCFVDKMSDVLKNSILQQWGIFRPSDGAFVSEFVERSSIPKCVGSSDSNKYNGAWFRPNCDYATSGYDERTYMFGDRMNGGSMGGVAKEEVTPTRNQGDPPYCGCSVQKPEPRDPTCTNDCTYDDSVYLDLVYTNKYLPVVYKDFQLNPDAIDYYQMFWVPMNESLCEFKQRCNWNNFSASCENDVHRNGGFFCRDEWGSDRTSVGGCGYFQGWSYSKSDTQSDTSSCDAIGGKQIATAEGKQLCLTNDTLKATNARTCLDTCTSEDGPRPGLEYICKMNLPEGQFQCPQLTVTNEWGWTPYVSSMWTYNPSTYKQSVYCQLFVDQSQCSNYEGYSWQLKSSSPEEQMRDIQDTCQSDYCFSTKISNAEDCFALRLQSTYAYWNQKLNNSQGLCIQSLSHQWGTNRDFAALKSQCESVDGFKYYIGRAYVKPLYDTQQSCEAGKCNQGMRDPNSLYGQWTDALSEADCAKTGFCSNVCYKCSSQVGWSFSESSEASICYTLNATDCRVENNVRVRSLKSGREVCVYTGSSVSTCQALPDSISVSCTQNAKRGQCQRNEFSEDLPCYWSMAPCQTRDQCTSQGRCMDYQLDPFTHWQNDPAMFDSEEEFREAISLSWNGTAFTKKTTVSCLVDGKLDPRGWRDCSTYYQWSSEEQRRLMQAQQQQQQPSTGGSSGVKMVTDPKSGSSAMGSGMISGQMDWTRMPQVSFAPTGCLLLNIRPEQCKAFQGQQIQRAFNKEQCLALTGCCEPGMACPWTLSPKNKTECEKCGGRVMPAFQFQGNSWIPGELVPMSWRKRAVEAVNRVGTGVNLVPFQNAMNQALIKIIGSLLRTELKCKYALMAPLIGEIACYCGMNSDPTCVNKYSGGGSSKQQLVSTSVSCNTSESIGGAGMQINFDSKSSIECAVNEIAIGFSKSSIVTTSANNSTNSSSTLQKRQTTTSTTVDASCYAYVQNSQQAYIGQVRGDCMVFTATVNVREIELCMPTKINIPWDSATYPVLGVATLASGNKYILQSDLTVFESNGVFCTRVSSSGTFCPVSVKAGAATATSGSQPSCGLVESMVQQVQTVNAQLAAGATQLKFSSSLQSTIKAGDRFPSIVVQFADANGQLVTGALATVTLKVQSTTGASIIGSARVSAVNGVATFTTRIGIDLVGTGYTLVATSGSLQPATSSQFSVTANSAYGLQFIQQPGGAIVSQPFIQTPIVRVVDQYGNLVSDTPSTVSLSLRTSSNAAASFSSDASSTATKQSQNGQCQFDAITIGQTGNGYTLTASATGLQSATSAQFNVVPASGYPVKLKFSTTVATPQAGATLSALTVQVVDGQNDALTSVNTGLISIALSQTGNQAAASQLSGTRTRPIQNGQATFSDLSILLGGSAYQFTATSTGLGQALTATFKVGGVKSLKFSSVPTSEEQATGFTVQVQVLDSDQQLVSSGGPSIYISLSLKQYSGTGTLTQPGQQTIRVQTQQGVATFGNLRISQPGTEYILVATSDYSSSLVAESDKIAITAPADKSLKDKANDVIKSLADRFGVSPGVIVGAVVGSLAVAAIGGVVYIKRKKSGKK